ncbi:hypothetical protein [Anaerosphaera multitolerans]|uniref:DUF3784 domain-containing protein n=1 Tax=Anaerosphaera multitolerans TaxID=2487351 RepID=A0A437S974_9FIRM|nr:hypothetical protein [Anaerosphaera multitolerans]RVU55670.1 hypothetical protein EF514_00195 [Anaerosphaera multitolerans]
MDSTSIMALIFIVVGVIFFYGGYLIGKKHKIELLRPFLYKNVRKKERDKYCEEFALVIYFLALGMAAIGLSYFFNIVKLGNIVFILSIAVAVINFFIVQKKYN